MHRTNLLFVSLVSLGIMGGCTWSPEQNLNGGGAAGGAGRRTSGGGPAGIGVTVDGSMQPTGDSNCGVTNHQGNRLPPDLLLVFDKSGSMLEDPTTGMNCTPAATCASKWNQMVTGVNMAVAASETTISWGLKLFSDPQRNGCVVNAGVEVPIALNSAGAITTRLAMTRANGNTPTTLALTRAGDYLAALPATDMNPKFIVLATDGAPNCGAGGGQQGAADDANAIAAVGAQAARGFGTFVIGLATANDAMATATLTGMSAMGGHARAGSPNYYLANNTADLVAALSTIGTQVTSCTFTLDAVPPVPNNVKVTADGATVPENDVNGWKYETGMRSITLTGSYCADVLNNVTKSVQVLFGCAGIPIP